MVIPFLPDIINGCFTRVNASFSARETDPFHVFFDKGILPQVKRSVYNASGNFPLGWLVMKYDEKFGTTLGSHSEVDCQIILAMPTEPGYTQQEREDISFKPRLMPIYYQLLKEMKREKWLVVVGDNGIKHTRSLLPYWGMADVNGADQPNLFKNKYIDAISIDIKGLKIRRENCSNVGYPVLDVIGYPISYKMLTFFDDLELIVDAGQATDPVGNATSVVIPFLIGKDYEVQQRGFGQLRSRRTVEIIRDTVNGGFALTDPYKFETGDTYFVIIRPMYLT